MRRFRMVQRHKIRTDNALHISWITDTHVHAPADRDPTHPEAVSGSRFFYTGATKLGKFVSEANTNQPHLVIHSGDFLEHYREDSMDLALGKWQQLNPAIPQAIMIGNHDLAQTNYTTLVNKFGRSAEPEIAGSKFNRSFSVSGNGVAVRVIVVDTNITPTGHTASVVGYFQDDALTWIENELSAMSENIALVVSHHGPHNTSSPAYFDADGAQAFRSLTFRVVQARPTVKIYSLFGHHHIVGTRQYTNLSSWIPGILCPAAVDTESSYYANVYVYADGNLVVDLKPLKYE